METGEARDRDLGLPGADGAAEGTERADQETEGRAALLISQAQDIREAGGRDMLEAFSQDEVIRRNVVSGDWDFYIAYGYLLGREEKPTQGRRSVPSAVRAPNSTRTEKRVAGMSEREFDALDERLARGEVIDPER